MQELKYFIDELKSFKSGLDVFNPWSGYNREYDIGPNAPQIRTNHLESFLRHRLGRAKLILVAEAVGYQGGRFSGIPLVSERILLGKQSAIKTSAIITSVTPLRTSNPECRHFKYKSQSREGFGEPTATIVWEAMMNNNVDPSKIATWNVFPFHPFKKNDSPLSNRTPREEEVRLGMSYFIRFMELFPGANIVAVGRIAENELKRCGIECAAVRHPSNGGANDFKNAFAGLCKRLL